MSFEREEGIELFPAIQGNDITPGSRIIIGESEARWGEIGLREDVEVAEVMVPVKFIKDVLKYYNNILVISNKCTHWVYYKKMICGNFLASGS